MLAFFKNFLLVGAKYSQNGVQFKSLEPQSFIT